MPRNDRRWILIASALALTACGGDPPADADSCGALCLDSVSGGDTDGAGSGDGQDDGSTGGDDGADDSGGPVDDTAGDEPQEICDQWDNDGDGEVDELCPCVAGDVQDCFAGPPGSVLECRGTTQTCSGGGSEQGGSWGACGGLCEGSTPSLDDPTMLRIWGAAAGDRFALAVGGGLADLDGDGELDLVAGSGAGDGMAPDVGAGYGLYGSPCMQGRTLDLATMPLDGGVDMDGFGGLVIDRVAGHGTSGHVTAGDIDGDGFGDVIGADTRYSAGILRGGAGGLPAMVDLSAPDGVQTFRMISAGGNGGIFDGATVGDFDGDGFDDVLMGAYHSYIPTCPCNSDGIGVWWGGNGLAPETPHDLDVAIGIPTVGVGAQHNFSVVGGFGDFDGDGWLDAAVGNGAANDGYVVPYVTEVFFGNSDRSLPDSMTTLDGHDGFALTGGAGRGNHPNHQHGDFDGDGLDDLVTYATVPYATSNEVYVMFGRPVFPASKEVADLDGGTIIHSSQQTLPSGLGGGAAMGVGDIDGDGFDDLAIGLEDTVQGGLVIVWGHAAVGDIDVDTHPEVLVIEGAPDLGPTQNLLIDDLDGDGLGDLIIGAPLADTPNGVDSGAGLVKYGSCLASLHNPGLQRGYDGPESLTGSPGADSIAAGRGDDVIEGGGGADAIAGGQGNDIIVVGDTDFRRIDGGLGLDTLRLEGSLTLDLRAMGRPTVQEIERFELGPGAQTLAMSSGDVSALSRTHNRIEVIADASDTVILEGAWVALGEVAGLAEYGYGALVVAIDPAASVLVQ